MSVKNPDRLPIDLIGSPTFFPALLTYIQTGSSSSLPLDQVIFKSILLCIVAGNKNLILRTPEDDIGPVVRAAVWTLSYLFNYPTQKVRLRSYSSHISPSAFFRSVFLPPRATDGSREDVNRYFASRGAVHGHPPHTGRPTSRGDHTRAASNSNELTQGPPVSRHPRGVSEPEVPHVPPSNAPPFQHAFTDPLPTHLSRKQEMQDSIEPLELPRALVLSGLEKASGSVQRALAQMISDKRLTLTDATSSHDFSYVNPSGDQDVWPLPSGFIMIYVCPIDTKERPAIHRSLIDKFAMSHNILLSQSVRYALRALPFSPQLHSGHAVSHSNPNSPSPALLSSLPHTTYTPPYPTIPLPNSQSPGLNRHSNFSSSSAPPPTSHLHSQFKKDILPEWFIELMRQYHQQTYFAPGLDMYLSDLFSAVRHHPQLDGMLLSVSCRKDAEDLARAARVVGTDLTGMELMRPPRHLTNDEDDGEGDEFSDVWIHPEIGESRVQIQNSNSESPQHSKRDGDESSTTYLLGNKPSSVWTSGISHGHDPSHSPSKSARLDARTFDAPTLTTSAGHHDNHTPNDAADVLIRPEIEVEALDVTEADVARTMPRAVTHRLRLRDGPEEETLASAVMGATFGPGIWINGGSRRESGKESGKKEGDDDPQEGMEGKEGRDERIQDGDSEGGPVGYGPLGIKDILVEILNRV